MIYSHTIRTTKIEELLRGIYTGKFYSSKRIGQFGGGCWQIKVKFEHLFRCLFTSC